MGKFQKAAHVALGLLMGLVLAFGTQSVIAATGSRTVTVTYRNIKTFIDGVETVLKDGSGTAIEPLIMFDTVYVPLRAVANALGKPVDWDNATSSVFIGKKVNTAVLSPTMLSSLDYLTTSTSATRFGDSNVRQGEPGTAMRWVSATQMSDNKGALWLDCFKFRSLRYSSDSSREDFRREYFLDKAYKSLTGTIFLSSETPATRCYAYVEILSGKESLYKSDKISTGSAPIEFSVDLTGKEFLTIKVYDNGGGNIGATDQIEWGLSALTLWK